MTGWKTTLLREGNCSGSTFIFRGLQLLKNPDHVPKNAVFRQVLEFLTAITIPILSLRHLFKKIQSLMNLTYQSPVHRLPNFVHVRFIYDWTPKTRPSKHRENFRRYDWKTRASAQFVGLKIEKKNDLPGSFSGHFSGWD